MTSSALCALAKIGLIEFHRRLRPDPEERYHISTWHITGLNLCQAANRINICVEQTK